MKILTTILLFCGLAFGQGSEIKRPTFDMEAGASSWISTNCGIATYNNNATASPLAYDDVGLTTGSSFSVTTSGTNRVTGRTFSTWESTANPYTALTLSVSHSRVASGSDLGDKAKVVYSLDSGSTWTLLATPTGAQTTTTIALSASQDLSKIKVGGCVFTGNADPGSATGSVKLWDIWTTGTVTGASGGNGSGSGTAVQPVQFN